MSLTGQMVRISSWPRLATRRCGCRRRPPSVQRVARRTFVTMYWSGVGALNGLDPNDPASVAWAAECVGVTAPCCVPALLARTDRGATRSSARMA